MEDSRSESFYKNEALRYCQEAYEKQTEGFFDEAVKLYQQSIALYPTAEAHTFLGWAYSLQGRYDDAIRECHKAIEIDPSFGNPYNDIGAYLIEKGELDEAIAWLEKAKSATRYESYCFPHYNLGRIWEQKGDWGKAVNSYRAALREKPDYTLAQRALTRIQAMLN
ncbi:MAG: tetratricopeptide repeat protein [Candidatus Omnitrophica bacterium]|nr:tetratricopeptide repeat protein [Candidatus Omnitrophota bacterium]